MFKILFELYIFAKEKYEEKVKINTYILLETVKQFLKRNNYLNKDFF